MCPAKSAEASSMLHLPRCRQGLVQAFLGPLGRKATCVLTSLYIPGRLLYVQNDDLGKLCITAQSSPIPVSSCVCCASRVSSHVKNCCSMELITINVRLFFNTILTLKLDLVKASCYSLKNSPKKNSVSR